MAGPDGALGHAVISGLRRVLGDDEPALLADRFRAEAAVGARLRSRKRLNISFGRFSFGQKTTPRD